MSSQKRSLTAGFVGAVLACAQLAAAGVVVVDPVAAGVPGDVALMQAVAGAADGDILLVRAGAYGTQVQSYSIQNKGFVLINDSLAPLSLPAIEISNVPAGSRMVIRGFTIASKSNVKSAMRVASCIGPVWIEECNLLGADGVAATTGSLPATVALFASSVSSLTIVRVTVRGGAGGYDAATQVWSNGAPAVFLATALPNLEKPLFEGCSILGGSPPANASGQLVGGGAAAGLVSNSSGVWLMGCAVHGGDPPAGIPAGGIGLSGSSNSVILRDTTITGGGTASAISPQINVSQSGTPFRSFAVTAPVRTGQTATLSISGKSGDVCALLLGSPKQPVYSSLLDGPLVLSPLSVPGPVFVGTIGPSGTLAIGVPTVALPPSAPDGVALAIQGAVASTSATLEMGSLFVQVKAGI